MEERKGMNAGQRGVGFKDEFHSRIKFNRRGLLGMANEGKDSNGSQFFLTLGDTAELQGKNTLFGRVEGETIYNVARMGEMETGEGERPVYPVKITGVEVLVNPFKDMVRRARVAPVIQEKKAVEKKKKRKAGKQLLSFGDDGDGDDFQPVIKKAKFDTRVVMDTQESAEPKPKQPKEPKKKVVKPVSIDSSPEPKLASPKPLPNRPAKAETRDISSSPEPIQKFKSGLDRINAETEALLSSMKRDVQTAPVPEKKKTALAAMIPENTVRGRKRHPGESAPADQRALDILNAFKAKLEQVPPEKEVARRPEQAVDETLHKDGLVPDDEEAALCDLHFIANCQSCKKWEAQEEGEEEDDDIKGVGWMSHALSFKEDKLGKDLSYRRKAEDEMVVIDPREKARTLKEEKRAQREAKAGGSGRQWDQAKNDKLARQSALAGRGAK